MISSPTINGAAMTLRWLEVDERELDPALVLAHIIDAHRLAMLDDPARQAFADLERRRAAALGHLRGQVAVTGAIMDGVIFRIDHQDAALLGPDGVVQQGQRPVERPIQVEGGGGLGQDAEQGFRVALLARQLGGPLDDPLLEFVRQAARLGEQPAVLDGNRRLVRQGAEDLLLVLRVDVRLDNSAPKACR